MNESNDKILNIEYIFHLLKDGSVRRFAIEICKVKKKIVSTSWSAESASSWSDLSFHQCSNCPLDSSVVSKCPIALNLQAPIECFADHISIEEIELEIHVPQRTYRKRTRLQYGLQAFYGLLMASSGCPNMKFLAPMAIFHTPFSDMEETLLRTAFFYLMNQFFKKLDGQPYEFSIEGLKEHYRGVEKVNLGIIERTSEIEHLGEANQNAIVVLNSFAQMFSVNSALDLKMLKYIFEEN
ncbi:MAG: hypothetical protein CR997_11545 [Acidobacteria bacterium]|nr:MAG: hypothetical protein CR997_11545 [Acidobacteriota bacterium]